MATESTRVGVLALQGAFEEHRRCLELLGVQVQEVRLPEHLRGLNALILPGGESTVMSKLLQRYQLLDPIRKCALEGMPLWGTCAGMILLAREVEGAIPEQRGLGLMNLRVERNAFGRQVESCSLPLTLPWLGPEPFQAIFIRAPLALSLGGDLEVLAEHRGRVVAARQGPWLATAFHPELGKDLRLHRWFLKQIVGSASPALSTSGPPKPDPERV